MSSERDGGRDEETILIIHGSLRHNRRALYLSESRNDHRFRGNAVHSLTGFSISLCMCMICRLMTIQPRLACRMAPFHPNPSPVTGYAAALLQKPSLFPSAIAMP